MDVKIPTNTGKKPLYARWISPGTRRRELMFYAHRSVMRPRLRRLMGDAMAGALRLKNGLLFPQKSAQTIERARELADSGYVPLGKLLTNEQIDDIREFLRPYTAFDQADPSIRFPGESPPTGTYQGGYDQDVIVRCPHLLKLANDPALLAVAEEFLGAKPTISILPIWWSYAGRSAANQPQTFHRDVDDVRFIKLFVYLTDVDIEAGPHVFVKGSLNAPACRGLGRYSDEEIAAAYGTANIMQITGERGTAFFENTVGLHKAQRPLTRSRLAFQVEYSLYPVVVYDYAPTSLPASEMPYDRYVNRLFVRPT